jgi:hypothetical protein
MPAPTDNSLKSSLPVAKVWLRSFTRISGVLWFLLWSADYCCWDDSLASHEHHHRLLISKDFTFLAQPLPYWPNNLNIIENKHGRWCESARPIDHQQNFCPGGSIQRADQTQDWRANFMNRNSEKFRKGEPDSEISIENFLRSERSNGQSDMNSAGQSRLHRRIFWPEPRKWHKNQWLDIELDPKISPSSRRSENMARRRYSGPSSKICGRAIGQNHRPSNRESRKQSSCSSSCFGAAQWPLNEERNPEIAFRRLAPKSWRSWNCEYFLARGYLSVPVRQC